MAKIQTRLFIGKQLTKLAHDERIWGTVGRYTVKRIKDQTRLGKSLVTNSPLKPITGTTTRLKEMDISFGTKVSKFYSLGASNLTFTGQLLNAIFFILKPIKGNFGVIIGVNNKLRKKTQREKFDKTPPKSNKQVADEVAAAGRPFMGMDKIGRDEITKIINRFFIRELRRLGKK